MEDIISIRSVEQNDVKQVLNLYKKHILSSYVSFETEVPAENEFFIRIKKIQETLPWLVCFYKGDFAGYAYASDHRSRKAYQWSKEVSVYVVEKYHGKGIAKGLYTTLFEILKQLGIANVLAGIALPNKKSVVFHEKMGFSKIGIYHNIGYKLGKFRDVGWWEKMIQHPTFIPGMIKTIEHIEGTPNWMMAIKSGSQKIS